MTYQLYEKLGLDSSWAFVFVVRPLREQRIDLVYEDDRRLKGSGDLEQRPHHLLAFAHPLRGQRRRADREKCRPRLTGDAFTWTGLLSVQNHYNKLFHDQWGYWRFPVLNNLENLIVENCNLLEIDQSTKNTLVFIILKEEFLNRHTARGHR